MNYYTYKQLLVRAIVELQLEEASRRRPFHRETYRKKIKDIASVEGVQLGKHWENHVKKAVGELSDTKVIRARGRDEYVVFSAAGVKKHAQAIQHYGPFGALSLYKKSQFLKSIAGTSRRARSINLASQPSKTQQKEIASLRASLAESKDTNKSIAFELEEVRMARDDLELLLLDMNRPPTPPPSHIGNPTVRFCDAEMLSISTSPRPGADPTIPSDRDSSPTPSSFPDNSRTPQTVPVGSRPINSLIQHPSGSFLNTISNQFTPSPSPEPRLKRPAVIDDGSHRVDNEEDNTSENFDFEDMGMEVDFENATSIEKEGADQDVSRGKQVQHDSSEDTQRFDSGDAVATRDVEHLETIRQLAIAKQDQEALAQDLSSATKERDALRSELQGLRAKIGELSDQIGGLNTELATATRTAEVLQTQKEECEQARIATVGENTHLSYKIANYELEVTRLMDGATRLSATLSQSTSECDNLRAQLKQRDSQLESSYILHRETIVDLAATQEQLHSAQQDLHAVRVDLQSSRDKHEEAHKQLAAQVEANKNEIARLSTTLALAEADLSNTRQEAATHQSRLKSELEEAHEQIAVLSEDLQNVRDAWDRANAMKQAADKMIQESLYPQRGQKRDPSFRDSGISMVS